MVKLYPVQITLIFPVKYFFREYPPGIATEIRPGISREIPSEFSKKIIDEFSVLFFLDFRLKYRQKVMSSSHSNFSAE